MSRGESYAYRIYYSLIFIHLVSNVLNKTYAPFDENYFAPTGILMWLPFNIVSSVSELAQWLVGSLLLVGIIKPNYFGRSTLWSFIIFILYVLALNYRFSFSHFPYLEMIPILSLFGFILGTDLKQKFSNGFLLLSAVYFFSGLAKIRFSGAEWLAPESIKEIILYSAHVRPVLILDIFDLAQIKEILQYEIALQLLSICVLIFELVFPIFIFFSFRFKILFIILTFAFHCFNLFVIGIYSTSLLLSLYSMFILLYFEKKTCEDRNLQDSADLKKDLS